MKKIFIIALALSAMLCTSCEKLYVANGSLGVVNVVYKETPNGPLYAMGRGTYYKGDYKNNKNLVATTPIVFKDYKTNPDNVFGIFMYTEDGKKCYFFDFDGTDMLSGTSSTKSLETFVPIKSDGIDHIGTFADKYYGYIIKYSYDRGAECSTEYYILSTLDGNVYGVICEVYYLSVGPYAQMTFGFHGYAYKDIKTQKYGANTITELVPRHEKYSGAELERQKKLRTPTIFEPNYDEIIEMELQNGRSIWYARQGNVWTAKEVVNESHVRPVPVDNKLLAKVQKMEIRDSARIKKERSGPFVHTKLVHGQRLGTKEYSIAYL